MVKKQSRKKWFGKYIGSHIIRRKPECSKGAVIDVVANEVMANINVLSPRGNNIRFRDGTRTLIITENRKRMRGRQIDKCQEKFDPQSLLEGMGECIVF